MTTFDKITIMTHCPLCGVAKASDVFIEGKNNGAWSPKFYCGTVAQPFQSEVKVETEMCRLIQQMRGPKPTQPDTELLPLLDLPLNRKLSLRELLAH